MTDILVPIIIGALLAAEIAVTQWLDWNRKRQWDEDVIIPFLINISSKLGGS
jgi:hypothetical protein